MQPNRQTVKERQTAKFECISFTLPVWTYAFLSLPLNAIPERKGVLYVANAEIENEGYYECEGQDEKGNRFNAFGHLRVLSE